MPPYPFIFSNERRYRLLRHFVFWFCWWLFESVLYSFVGRVLVTSVFVRWVIVAVETIFFLAQHMFLTYSLIYFIVPVFLLKGRYWAAAVGTLSLFLLSGVLGALLSLHLLDDFRVFMLGKVYGRSFLEHKYDFWLSLMAALRGGINISGLAMAIKLMKYWYLKEQRNLQLQKENIAVQLQLLRAQVHPHFLFNTLNNIYSNAQVGAPETPVLIAGLSDMLRYILYECNQPLVPLAKELKMLQDYILLEKIRYGNRLELNIALPGDTKELYIAPLLLLSFVENCFKHGASHMLEQPWISLHVAIEGDWMKMKLLNAKMPEGERTVGYAEGGIGLTNARKRLDLLYPGCYELLINREEEVFIVNLRLQLTTKRMIEELRPAADLYPGQGGEVHEFGNN